MKEKTLVFIIGLLVGAIITSLGFLIYEKTNKNSNYMPNQDRMQMMERPEGEKPNGERPPDMPPDMPPNMPREMQNDENRPEPPSNNNFSTN